MEARAPDFDLPGVTQSMANDSKASVFSSIFGRGKKERKEAEEAAELEARQRLERRIEQALSGMSVGLLDSSAAERDAA